MDDTSDIDPAIAAAMGFSSFGAAPAAKRRKFNADDTYVEGQASREQQKQRKDRQQGSGANTMALGTRRNAPSGDVAQAVSDADVVPERTTVAIGQQNLSSVDAAELGGSGNKAGGKKKSKGKQAAPAGLAGFLSRGQQLPARPQPAVQEQSQPIASDSLTTTRTPIAAGIGAQPSVEARSVPEAVSAEAQTGGITDQTHQSGLSAYRRGVKNERGDMVYFMPSFLEDPWAALT